MVLASTLVTLVHAVEFIETVVAPAAKLKPVMVIVLPMQAGLGEILVTPI